MGAAGLDFETWDSANLNARNYAAGDLCLPMKIVGHLDMTMYATMWS